MLKDPFWIYTHILDEIFKLQDSAVWAIRDQVRPIEKAKKPKGRPQPDYRRLHDIARHAIHVTESLDVAVRNLEFILKAHERYAAAASTSINTSTSSGFGNPSNSNIQHHIYNTIHTHLEFTSSCLTALRHRSIANEKRLANEIQLAFNTVAQHDASLSVKISHAMMSDSTALKTLAFVTFAFLPPTFISSVFSMSFFKYDDNDGFIVSKEFWIYWAFAVPTTVITTLLWQFWHKISPKERRERPLRNAATFELRDLV